MLKIGITGGIGTGKSIVCKFFELLGIPVYYADERAKYLINHDLQLQKEIKELLGRQAFNEQGYNRAWVAQQVFRNDALLQQLNALIYPRMQADTQQWMQKHASFPYVLREAALISSNHIFDKIIVLSSPMALRIERIQNRDRHRSAAEIEAIIQKQISEDAYEQLADYQIINDEKSLLIPQVLSLHQAFLKVKAGF